MLLYLSFFTLVFTARRYAEYDNIYKNQPPPYEGSAWNFVTAVRLKKTRMMPLPDRQRMKELCQKLNVKIIFRGT